MSAPLSSSESSTSPSSLSSSAELVSLLRKATHPWLSHHRPAAASVVMSPSSAPTSAVGHRCSGGPTNTSGRPPAASGNRSNAEALTDPAGDDMGDGKGLLGEAELACWASFGDDAHAWHGCGDGIAGKLTATLAAGAVEPGAAGDRCMATESEPRWAKVAACRIPVARKRRRAEHVRARRASQRAINGAM